MKTGFSLWELAHRDLFPCKLYRVWVCSEPKNGRHFQLHKAINHWINVGKPLKSFRRYLWPLWLFWCKKSLDKNLWFLHNLLLSRRNSVAVLCFSGSFYGQETTASTITIYLLVLLSMTFNRLPWYLGSLREAEEKKKMDSQFPEHNLFADKHIPSALQPIGYTANGGCIWDVYDGRTFFCFFPKQ